MVLYIYSLLYFFKILAYFCFNSCHNIVSLGLLTSAKPTNLECSQCKTSLLRLMFVLIFVYNLSIMFIIPI